MDLLSSASLSESVSSIRAAFRRLKRALFGGAFLFPMGSRSPCCSARSIPIGGITKEKQFSKIQHDVISRGIFTSTTDLSRKLIREIKQYNKTATPFRWRVKNADNRIKPVTQ
jgi:hypothetical protein